MIDLVTHKRVRVYYAKLVALEMADPTSGFGGRYTTATQGRLVVEAQQHLLMSFAHLTRDLDGFLYFSHTQTLSQSEERDRTEQAREEHLQRTGQYFSDLKRGPLGQAQGNAKKARFGTWALQHQADLRKATLRSIV